MSSCGGWITETSINRHVIFSYGCAAQFKSKIPFSRLVNNCCCFRSVFYILCIRLVQILSGGACQRSQLCGKLPQRKFFFLLEDMEHREKPTKLIAIKNTRSLHAMQLSRAPPGLSGSTGAFRSGLLPRFWTPRTPATAIRHCDQQGADFEYKLLSCFCSKCLSKEDTCLNEKYTGEWQKCTLYKKETRPKKGAAKRKLDTPDFVSFCLFLHISSGT